MSFATDRQQIKEVLETVEQALATTDAALLPDCLDALAAARDLYRRVDAMEGARALDEVTDALRQTQAGAIPLAEAGPLCRAVLRQLLGGLPPAPSASRRRIVFLPVKAADWHTFHSLWRLLSEDEARFAVCVIPIPYAPRKEHGLGEWQCDRALFPPEVPTLDWRTADLADLRPDVIFIHDPYDGESFDHTVEPRFYTPVLKRYAKELVYIPPFLTERNIPLDMRNSPGILNADHVIVESEALRTRYEEFYPGGGAPQGKILALGTPMFDAARRKKRSDYTLPAEWQARIGGRKVVLYYNGTVAFWKNRDIYLDKVREVLATFRERKDVVLWWRENPMMEATFDSWKPDEPRRKEAEDAYRALRRQYVEAGWGIFDDSEDWERAVACTDACYGDFCSLTRFYLSTGKPVLQQELREVNRRYLSMWITKPEEFPESNAFYFLEGYRQMLCRFDYTAGTVTEKAEIPKELLSPRKDVIISYGCTYRLPDKTILVPYQHDTVLEFDHASKTFRPVLQLTNECHILNFVELCWAVPYKNYVYFLGHRCPFILRYDTETGEYSRLTQWFELLRPYLPELPTADLPDNYFLVSLNIQDNLLFLTSQLANIVLVMNLDTEEMTRETVGEPENRSWGIDFDGTYFWLTDWKTGALTRWRRETGETTTFRRYLEELPFIENDCPFGGPLCFDGRVHLYRSGFLHDVQVDPVTGELLADDDSDKLHFCLYRSLDRTKLLHIYTEDGQWKARIFRGSEAQPLPFSLEAFNEGMTLEPLEDERCHDERRLPLAAFLDRLGEGTVSGKVDAENYGGRAIYRWLTENGTGAAP